MPVLVNDGRMKLVHPATLDEMVDALGGLSGLCEVFGWQGGTIHQAKSELKERLAPMGVFENKDGHLCEVIIGDRVFGADHPGRVKAGAQ